MTHKQTVRVTVVPTIHVPVDPAGLVDALRRSLPPEALREIAALLVAESTPAPATDAVADQISEQEMAVYECVRRSGRWLTAREIAASSGVANRTARHHAAALSKAGVFEVSKAVHGGYRYRLCSDPSGAARRSRARLEEAAVVTRRAAP